LLRAADVSFAYGAASVLTGVSLEIRAGELTGILGPNGSGKTTLLKLLAGTLAPSAGTVSLDGVGVGRIGRTALARRIAVVPQELQLAFDYTVLEIALMGRYPHLGPFELEGPDDVEIARRALEATGTWPLARRPFATLSGGEKQRVVIASALAQFAPHTNPPPALAAAPPQILLLDEPTASLDVHYQVEVASLLRRLNRQRGITVLVSTHDLNFAASVCRELVLIRGGEVLTAGPTERVLTPARVRALYGVEAHVSFHEVAGHLTVVPLPPQEPFATDVP
jgi:iron complex transport system ATP-binding protein